jgi:hypothetical protein
VATVPCSLSQEEAREDIRGEGWRLCWELGRLCGSGSAVAVPQAQHLLAFIL